MLYVNYTSIKLGKNPRYRTVPAISLSHTLVNLSSHCCACQSPVSCPYRLPFPECHGNGILQRVAFESGLHFLECLWGSPCLRMYQEFISLYCWVSVHRRHVFQFIHSPGETHLGCLQVLAIMNKATIKSHV